MTNRAIFDHPVLVVAESRDMRLRLHNSLTSPKVLSEEIYTPPSREDALIEHLCEDTQFSVVLVHVETYSGSVLKFLETLSRRVSGPTIVLTTCPDTSEVCKERFGMTVLPRPDIFDQATLENILPLTSHLSTLKANNSRYEKQMELTQRRFDDLANHFSEWIWEVDKTLTLTFSSKRKRPTRDADSGQSFTHCFLDEELHRIEEDFSTLFKTPQPFYDIEYWGKDQYGHHTCWSLTGVPVYDAEGVILGYRGVAKEITQQKVAADKIYELTNLDSLTGLFNRQRFTEEARRLLNTSVENDKSVAIALIDIDHFSYVNETYGNAVGDMLLKHIAHHIKNYEGGHMLTARSSSNEFAVMFGNMDIAQAQAHLHDLLASLRKKPILYKGVNVQTTLSTGYAHAPLHGNGVEDLFSAAAVALQKSKEHGRNRIEEYTEHFNQHQETSEKLSQLDFLSKCLEDSTDKLILHFQPIVPLNGDMDPHPRYEVLLRLLDTNGDLISARDHIKVAEEFGLASKVDDYVTGRSIDLLQKWHKAGKNISLAVNISSCTFSDDVALAAIAEKLEKAALPQGSLILEITETAILRDLIKVKEVITRFKTLGAMFALDDCGAGYSSFNYIKQLELDFIKIDGTFVRHLHNHQSKDAAFIKALRDVAQRMKIMTVAEMVETSEAADTLKHLGVDFGQGFYFGKPSPNVEDEDVTLH